MLVHHLEFLDSIGEHEAAKKAGWMLATKWDNQSPRPCEPVRIVKNSEARRPSGEHRIQVRVITLLRCWALGR
jgi:hypothetical protein